jgi:hypothetical protein
LVCVVLAAAPAAWPAPAAGVGTDGGASDACAPEDAASDAYVGWRPLLRRVVARGGGVQDVYKLLHQGTMGPAHAVPDADAAQRWLESEWREMGGDGALSDSALADQTGAEALLEPIRPDGRLVRVHLAPLIRRVTRGAPAARRGEVAAAGLARLAIAMQRTASQWRGDLGELRLVWDAAAADTALWRGAAAGPNVAELTAEVQRAGWPAVHHSETYRRLHAPHYRVIAAEQLPPAWRDAAGAVPGEE